MTCFPAWPGLHCELLEEEAHLVHLYISRAEPRLAHNTCKYLKMFNSLVEWFARDFKQGKTFKSLEPILTTPEYPKELLLKPGS